MIRSNGQWGIIDVGIGDYGNIRAQLTEQLQQLAQSNGGQIQLDFILITHSHVDHGGYFSGLFEDNPNITMSDSCTVYLKDYEDNNPSYSNPEMESLYNNTQVYEGILDELEQRFGSGLSSHLLRSDYPPAAFGDFTLEFYNSGAEAAASGRLNDNSTVVLMTHKNGTRLLMMGDCELSAEENLMSGEMADLADIDILKAGHHGLASSTGVRFMAKMDPDAVVATGIYGMYVNGDGGSLAYKCRTSGVSMYSPQFNAEGLTLAFGEDQREYAFYNGISETVSAVPSPLKEGWITISPNFRIQVNEDLALVKEKPVL